MTKLIDVGIVGTGSHLPKKIMTNKEMEQIVETSDEWIKTRTGIEERRILEEEYATSDMATEAAKIALADANLSPEDLDLIIVGTCTPDMPFPATACIVQANLGAQKAAAFDVETACSGFLYALTIGEQFIKTGFYKNVLVIGAETLSRILDWEDRNTCVIFGDGAGAVVLQPVEQGHGILASHLGADGANGGFLTQPAGGTRMPATVETVENRMHTIKMDGSEVFKFAVRAMGKASMKVLEDSKLGLEDIDLLVPHQANVRIIDAAAKRLKLTKDKVYVNLNRVGNMSAASVPVALDEANKKGLIKKGDIVLLVAFGGGLTWGSSVMRWARN